MANKALKYAGIAAIINAIFIIPYSVLVIVFEAMPHSATAKTALVVATFIFLPAGVILIHGYFVLGGKTKLQSLKILSVAYLVLFFLNAFSVLLEIFYRRTIPAFVSNLLSVLLFGVFGIVFGIFVLKLRRKFGGIATALGVSYIISGALLVTVLLSFLAVIVMVINSALEAILFFRAAKKY